VQHAAADVSSPPTSIHERLNTFLAKGQPLLDCYTVDEIREGDRVKYVGPKEPPPLPSIQNPEPGELGWVVMWEPGVG
jgi:hypothetical protein